MISAYDRLKADYDVTIERLEETLSRLDGRDSVYDCLIAGYEAGPSHRSYFERELDYFRKARAKFSN